MISSPPLIIEEDGVVLNMHSGPDNFQIQAEQMRPSPAEPDSQKGKMVRLKRKSMALPDVASVSDARTPLVERSVRRSSRLSIGNEGFCPVRIEKEPSKKTKNWLVRINEETGETGPVELAVLQGWGINCGVDPGDLTEDVLLQAPPHRFSMKKLLNDPACVVPRAPQVFCSINSISPACYPYELVVNLMLLVTSGLACYLYEFIHEYT